MSNCNMNVKKQHGILGFSTLLGKLVGKVDVANLVSNSLRSILTRLTFNLTKSLIIILTFIVVIGCGNESKQEPQLIELNVPAPKTEQRKADTTLQQNADSIVATHKVVLTTTLGDIEIALCGNQAPLNVKNFVELCKRKFYDETLFHRVAKGYLIQGGDPFTKNESMKQSWGTGGSTWNLKTLSDEISPESPLMQKGYTLGTVAMANTMRPNTATSQFFIALDNTKDIAPSFSIIGMVTRGMDVVRKIEQGESDENDGTGQTPKNPVKILSTSVLELKSIDTE
jgi:cyclophilin family peptidyl-prolyl cis-trans isomerase